MAKILSILSFAGLAVLAAGTAHWGGLAMFWLASGADSVQIMRFILMALLFLQLVTRPPRHLAFRLVAGFTALGVAIWVVSATNDFTMLYTDALAFMAAAIAIGIMALERKALPRAKVPRNLYVPGQYFNVQSPGH